jgi:uncharacterized protein (TIGR00369 family)
MSRAEEIFRKAAFVADLGMRLESIEPGVCVSSLGISARHLQQDRFIHAGVQATMADHTAGAAAASLVEADETVLTIEYKINLLRPAMGQALRCKSTVLRPGRTVIVAESEVYTLGAGDSEKLTSKATITLAVVKRTESEEGEDATHHVSTREGYDRWSEIYDGEDNALVQLEEPLVDGLVGEVRGLDVADIGCGTGRHAIRLAKRGAQVTGVDFSEGMLAKARQKAEGSVKFLVHDLSERLPFVEGTFDRVLCALVLDHINDPTALFKELRRICKKDGFVVVTVMHPAMMLRGVQARFVDPASGKKTHVESAPNLIADYVTAIARAGLAIDLFAEHSVDEALAVRSPRSRKYLGWPLLITMRLLP